MLKRKVLGVFLLVSVMLPGLTFGQTAPKVYEAPKEVMDKIKDEGMNRSQVMKTLSYMTDVIGPRLTGSPGLKRANEWTRDQLTSYGLQNAHLESWGPFGRGWTLKRFTAMVHGPASFPLIAYPKAWSPGTNTLFPAPVVDPKAKKPKTPAPTADPSTAYTGDVVTFNPQNEAELEQYKGKLKGKIVLVGAVRELKAEFDPQGTRRNEANLLDLANAPDPNAPRPAGSGPTPNPGAAGQFQFNARRFRFLHEEGAAVLIDTAAKGDGGTIFVQGANAVQAPPPAAGGTPTPNVPVRDKNAVVPIQLVATPEHFNRMSRMIAAGEKLTMTVDLAVEFQDTDPNAYNTIAEIPGTDKSDEIVMLGGHLDSWHGATGATDNGAGCAVMMEAVRIIQALGLKPRRTIRIALWSGEEQGLLGSRAYVRQHFGYRGDPNAPAFGGGGGQNAANQALTKLPAYDKLSAYFNIDNGTGKIRGVYMQGNEGVRPIFRSWLAPFKGMGADTLTIANTGGTDHQAFDGIGLPGFQFIQDEVEYSTRTHHSNMDSFDRIQADDMKQMAIILAAFVYQTAMMDDKLPRKPVR
ncbi:MAG: M20/M25/M40 family metallo-hydrolase [Pyrinomonadaceae bacterium]